MHEKAHAAGAVAFIFFWARYKLYLHIFFSRVYVFSRYDRTPGLTGAPGAKPNCSARPLAKTFLNEKQHSSQESDPKAVQFFAL